MDSDDAGLDKIHISGLKHFASEKLTGKPMLRALILSERDHLSVEEYLAKMETWLKIFNMKK